MNTLVQNRSQMIAAALSAALLLAGAAEAAARTIAVVAEAAIHPVAEAAAVAVARLEAGLLLVGEARIERLEVGQNGIHGG